jgi:hypothetical protein
MIEPNFVAIGKIPGESIFVHKDDALLIVSGENTSRIKCIAIDFEEKRVSMPVIIDTLLKICPQTDICSEGERTVISDLVLRT